MPTPIPTTTRALVESRGAATSAPASAMVGGGAIAASGTDGTSGCEISGSREATASEDGDADEEKTGIQVCSEEAVLDTINRVAGAAWTPLCRTVLRFDVFARTLQGAYTDLLMEHRDVEEDCLRTEFHFLFRRNEAGVRVPATDFAVSYTRNDSAGPDLMFWARDRADQIRLVLVQVKSGSVGPLMHALRSLDPMHMCPRDGEHRHEFQKLLRDPVAAPYFRKPIRVLVTTYAIPVIVRASMELWNEENPDQPVFAIQASHLSLGADLWRQYRPSSPKRVAIPKGGCRGFDLEPWHTDAPPSEVHERRLPPVFSATWGAIPGHLAAEFVRGVLQRHVSPADLQGAFLLAERRATRRFLRPPPPLAVSDEGFFFEAVAEAYTRAHPTGAITAAELRGRVAERMTFRAMKVDEFTIRETARILGVVVRVNEYSEERAFGDERCGGGSITIYRSWAQYSADDVTQTPVPPAPGLERLEPSAKRRLTVHNTSFNRYDLRCISPLLSSPNDP